MTIPYQAMNTVFEFTVYPPSPDMHEEEIRQVTDQAFAAIEEMEQLSSRWIPTSQTSRVNKLAAREPVHVGGTILTLLLDSKRLNQDTGGAFDVTVAPLLELWGIYKKQGHFPAASELDAACKKVGFDKVTIDETAETVKFGAEGMQLDFGGIAKGLAADCAAKVLRANGIKAARISAGTSTIVTVGVPLDVPYWTVRIRDEYNASNPFVDEVKLTNESLSTSSSSERFVELDGKKYGHIFDPRTGMPVEGILSATAIAPAGVESDGLSTAFFVMGKEAVEAYCRAHPEVRAILVFLKDGAPQPVHINFRD